MYGKLAMTCFTNQVLFPSNCPRPPLYSTCISELPSPFKKNLTVNTYSKKLKGKTV
jgi:hypothetical protein